jgi:hypothetical protein
MTTRLSRSLKASINKQLQKDPQIMAQTRAIIRGQFEVLHKKMMQDFESHPVTRELKSGSGSSNISGSLPRGNLFGFIGFENGDDPTAQIEKLLSRTEIILKRRAMGSNGFIWTYLVTAPSLNELYKASPMPWASGLSWVQEMEGKGIPNLGQYMFKRSSVGRSGAGIQNSKLSGGGRVKIDYVKSLLNKFESDLNSIDASRVSKKYF